MSVRIFFSASNNNIFCRNDVQAIDFLRKGSYAPGLVLINLICLVRPILTYNSEISFMDYFLVIL